MSVRQSGDAQKPLPEKTVSDGAAGARLWREYDRMMEGEGVMADLRICVQNGQGEEKCLACGKDRIHLVFRGEYEPGDRIVFETDETDAYYVIRADSCMDEAYVWLTEPQVIFEIPFEMQRISKNAGCFAGETHYLTMRKAQPKENQNYRNLAKNVIDRHDASGCYPHVSANAETRGEALFAVQNVIDGVTANECHWPWPYQSWGINRREDAMLTLEFGRPVDIDRICLVTRADFPHDSWWTEATVTFSDGSTEVLSMEKSARPHEFAVERTGITWLTLGKLIKADDPSPFPALTQIEVYGKNTI